MKKYRIAFGRFMQETNSFSSVFTTEEDFRRTHYSQDGDLLIACQPKNWEVEGFLKNLELSGFIKAVSANKELDIEPVPILSTWTISGGPVKKEFFEKVCEDFQEKLKNAGELDGVFLALHGAMGVEGVEEPEVVLVQKIKEIIGENKPVITTMDLHANITKKKFETIDMIFAYRSNPHWDMARTGFRAGDILIKALSEQVKPAISWRTLPMLLGGGTTIDFLPPMRAIFEKMKEFEQDPRVLYCSLFMCHPFLDSPELSWTIYVITNNDKELGDHIAEELADMAWAVRHKKPPKFLNPEELLKKVRSMSLVRKLGCIAVCDASDVVGAGGTGENTALLKYLLENAKDLVSYVPIRDPETVTQLWETNINEEVEVTVGGKLQPEINEPVVIKGKVLTKKDTKSFGKTLVLDIGHIKLVITEGYAMPMKPSFYEDLGLNTFSADIVIVKNFFHFRLYFLVKSRKALYVKTQGITDLDRILDIKLNYPVFPKEDLKDWREIDKIKRGISENTKEYNSNIQYKLQKNINKKKVAFYSSIGFGVLLFAIKKFKKK